MRLSTATWRATHNRADAGEFERDKAVAPECGDESGGRTLFVARTATREGNLLNILHRTTTVKRNRAMRNFGAATHRPKASLHVSYESLRHGMLITE